MAYQSASKDGSENKNTRAAKVVTFAPDASVRVIPPGEGTWENGQRTAHAPSMWQIANQDNILAHTLDEIAEQERAEAELAKSMQIRMKPLQRSSYKVTPRRKPVHQQRPAAVKVTFESFLSEHQMPNCESVKTPTSIKSFASASSIKSLSQRFKAKLRKE